MKNTFKDISRDYDRETGGERHAMALSDKFWVSVLHRLTGFGYMEWETAIVRIREDDDPLKFKRGKWDERELLIVRGDRRKELEGKTQEEIMEWYAKHSNERNSFDTIMNALKEEVPE